MRKNLLLYIVIIVVVSLFLFYQFYTPQVHTFGPTTGNTLFILGSVHGNEPSGTNACYRLIDYLKDKELDIQVIIMPMPNPLGYYLDSRYQLKPFHRDINRNFSDVGKDRISQIILNYVRKADFIVDLHEGYEYHSRYPKSMGSSIIPNQSDVAVSISKSIVKSVNSTIRDKDKQFMVSDFYTKETCYLPDSLACYCNKHKKNYISIETTGLLHNKQSLEIRVNQHYLLLLEIIYKINNP